MRSYHGIEEQKLTDIDGELKSQLTSFDVELLERAEYQLSQINKGCLLAV